MGWWQGRDRRMACRIFELYQKLGFGNVRMYVCVYVPCDADMVHVLCVVCDVCAKKMKKKSPARCRAGHPTRKVMEAFSRVAVSPDFSIRAGLHTLWKGVFWDLPFPLTWSGLFRALPSDGIDFAFPKRTLRWE